MPLQRVTDKGSNAPENVEHAVRVIGRSRVRRAVFLSVHSGRKQAKTVGEIAEETEEGRQQVLNAAVALAQQGIIHKEPRGRGVAYRRDPFYQANRANVLRYVDHPKRLERLATKRRPAVAPTRSLTITVRLPRARPRARYPSGDPMSRFGAAAVRILVPRGGTG